jgi:RHS repeat-associated protein
MNSSLPETGRLDRCLPEQGSIKQSNLGNGLVEARSYDTYRQQLTGVSLGPNGSVLNLGFDYCTGTPPQTSCTTNNGNLQSQTISPLGVTQNYTYDSYIRLYTSGEKAGTTTTWSENFNYDSFGNRWVLPNSVGITLSPWTVTTNYYNSATNRMTYNNFGYDNGGNQTTISPYTVSYDVENRQSGFTSTSNGSATYTYDGDGRRVEKTAGGVTTTYVYDAAGNLAAEYSSQPPSMPCQTCYLTTDHLGSTRAITSQTGGLVSRHDFLPFGEELATTNRTPAQGYGVADNVMQRYTGQQRDLEGPVLDYFGARYFQGAQGRFTSPDAPFADQGPVDPQSWNMFTYVRNNPLKNTDPNGRDCQDGLSSCANYILGGLMSVANVVPNTATLVNHGINLLTGSNIPDAPTLQPSNVDQAQGMQAGNAMMLVSPLAELGATEIAASAAVEAPQITRNAAQGAAFQNQVAADTALTDANVVQNVTVRTQSGVRTQIDVMSTNSSGNIVLQEAKSSVTAPLTPNQAAAHPEIANSGATVVGQGKPPYVGGTQIPPTPVKVVRPQCPGGSGCSQ